MASVDRTDIVRRARDTLALYFLRGAAPAPGAVAFELIALDVEGCTTGAAATVCLDCVSRVAAEAFSCMYGMRPPAVAEPATWQALVQVGAAPVYDVLPLAELAYDTFCAQCELPIVGNHVNACDGRSYVAGPREGQSCFCPDILRLHPVPRGDGKQLEDQHGRRYWERTFETRQRCDACHGPVNPQEICFIRLRETVILCCRCTAVL